MVATGKMQLQKTEEGSLTVALAGSWKLGQELPSADEVLHALEDMPAIGSIVFDTRELAEWDSGLLIFLKQLSEFSAQKKITIEESGLPEGARKLLALAAAVPAKKDARKAEGKVPFLAHVGNETVDFFRAAGDMLAFIGDTVIAFLNLLRGKAQYRKSDLWLIVESCGGQALPIVSLICFLVGLILAFIGAIQLQLFGAQIYVADLVGIAMVRLMAAATFLGLCPPLWATKQAGHFLKPGEKLKPGEYVWEPEVSPEGPVAVMVSLPEQTRISSS